MASTPQYLGPQRYRAFTWDKVDKRKGPTRVFATEYEAYDWAKAWERDRVASAKAHGFEVVVRTEKVSFAEYALKQWQPVGKPSTRDTKRAQARALTTIWPTEDLKAITPTMVQASFYAMEARGWSASTISGRFVVMRQIFQAAKKAELIDADPTEGIRGPKTCLSMATRRPMSDDEIERLLVHLPVWLHAAVWLGRDCGLRISEVVGLRWFRLDLLNNTVVVADMLLSDGKTIRETPKNDEPEIIPLTPRAAQALRKHLELWPGTSMERVFRDPTRSTTVYLNQEMLRRRWNTARKAADLAAPAPRWHDLRHTRGQTLADAGVPLQDIAALLRQRSLTSAQVYIGKTSMARKRECLAQADAPRGLVAVS